MITNDTGQVVSRRDFLPFGEDINAGIGGRTGETGQKYSVAEDTVRQKFTGYQKDTETSLDFAEARMYENRFGRFTAVDPLMASGYSANPQTFNRYIYVGNGPLIRSDPAGLDWFEIVVGGRKKYRWSSDNKTFSDGSSVEGATVVTLNAAGEFSYEACVNADCSESATAYLRDGGTWEWAGFFRDMRKELGKSGEFLTSEFREGFPRLREDAAYFSEDPLGERGLGNPGLTFVTGGMSTGLRGAAKAVGSLDDAAAVTKVEQYSLRAAKDGLYPVMERGSKQPVGEIFLHRGDVWKYGVTQNPATRYSQSFLNNTGQGLQFISE
ncbi:MAG: RHS repeat-associated core domain-containing protein, partial [Pyrinomonadaceae bacterium]